MTALSAIGSFTNCNKGICTLINNHIGDIRLPGARPKPTAPPPKTQITVNGTPAVVAKGVPAKAPVANRKSNLA